MDRIFIGVRIGVLQRSENLRVDKGKSEKWLPAAEVNGEGVFIEFNKETLEKWLAIPSVKALSRRYEECYEEFCNAKGWTLNVKRNATYVLMHMIRNV